MTDVSGDEVFCLQVTGQPEGEASEKKGERETTVRGQSSLEEPKRCVMTQATPTRISKVLMPSSLEDPRVGEGRAARVQAPHRLDPQSWGRGYVVMVMVMVMVVVRAW